MASTYLTRTPSSSGNRKTFTFSLWVKRSGLGFGTFYSQYNSSSNNLNSSFYFDGQDNLIFWNYNSAYTVNVETTRVFRDTNAWYHIVLSVDTTQATASNRVKMYVNGVQETSFSSSTYPSQNLDLFVNENKTQQIGIFRYASDNYYFFDGAMSHFHFIDGTAYTPSAFGETDATTGIWKPKTAPSVTYGTNGFFLKFENSGAMGTDSSGNSNNFSVGGGTMTQLIDTPSNVFATWNPLVITSAGGVAVRTPAFQNGNTTALFDDSGNNEFAISTLAPSKGKYYAEFKWVNATGNAASTVGIVKSDFAIQTDVNDQGVVYKGDGNKVVNNSSSSYGASWTTGDIIAIVLDCDSNTVNFYKNNAPQGSISIDADTNWYMFCSSYALSSVTRSVNANFGNGYFGTTAITSAGSNGNGSLFEYDVPSGYYALNTKNINTYG